MAANSWIIHLKGKPAPKGWLLEGVPQLKMKDHLV
jgi:hypothetical protein